ncbi:MAG: hypothetical protein AB7S93_24400 [Xanthobacteraceae bacterium]
MAKKATAKSVEALTHDEAKRKNIPTAEYQSVLEKEQQNPKKAFYPRNRDLDPQFAGAARTSRIGATSSSTRRRSTSRRRSTPRS